MWTDGGSDCLFPIFSPSSNFPRFPSFFRFYRFPVPVFPFPHIPPISPSFIVCGIARRVTSPRWRRPPRQNLSWGRSRRRGALSTSSMISARRGDIDRVRVRVHRSGRGEGDTMGGIVHSCRRYIFTLPFMLRSLDAQDKMGHWPDTRLNASENNVFRIVV